MVPSCSGRNLVLSLASLILLTVVEVVLFTSVDKKWYTKLLRLHVWAIVELLLFTSARYVWRRVTHLFNTKNLLTFGGLFRVLLFIVLSLSLLAMPVGLLLIHTDPSLLAPISSVSLGLNIFLFTSLVIADVTSFVVRKAICQFIVKKKHLTSASSTTDHPDGSFKSPSRESLESKSKLELKLRTLIALICALALSVAGIVGISGLTTERVTIPIRGLHRQLNGTTIVQISDIHLGAFTGRRRLSNILKLVNQLEGDIVVITGDLVDASVADLNEAVKPLAEIKSKHGVFYITGNHEYYTGDVDNWIDAVAKLKIKPLVNERQCLYSKESSCKDGLYIAGLEDYETRHMRYGSHSMDIHAALTGRTKGIPTIVLAHQPRAAAEAILWDDVRLVLSGHTHAGQFFPWMLFIYLFQPFFAGLYQPIPDVYVYVNPGTVYFMIPFRHYRPEITYITLVSA